MRLLGGRQITYSKWRESLANRTMTPGSCLPNHRWCIPLSFRNRSILIAVTGQAGVNHQEPSQEASILHAEWRTPMIREDISANEAASQSRRPGAVAEGSQINMGWTFPWREGSCQVGRAHLIGACREPGSASCIQHVTGATVSGRVHYSMALLKNPPIDGHETELEIR